MVAILALDTSSAWCSVSIEKGPGNETFHVCDEAAGNHFEQLSTIAERAVAAAEISYGDVTKVVVGTGPGSFTGLRIAMSFAKGLAWSLKVPLLGVSSFEAAARATSKPDRHWVCVVSDARREEVFWQCFDKNGHPLGKSPEVRIGSVRSISEAVMAETLAPSIEAVEFVTTDRIAPVVTGVTNISIVRSVSGGLIRSPRIAGSEGYSVVDLSNLEPQYVRAVAAQTIEERTGKPQ